MSEGAGKESLPPRERQRRTNRRQMSDTVALVSAAQAAEMLPKRHPRRQ